METTTQINQLVTEKEMGGGNRQRDGGTVCE